MQYINQKRLVTEIFYAAVKAVDPYEAVRSYKEKILSTYKNSNFKKLFVVGFGKAAYLMAKAIEDDLLVFIDNGIIITKYGHCPDKLQKIQVCEAGHPLPDENGLNCTNAMKKLLNNADEQTLVVCLISGGGSALLVSPYESISLSEKQKVTELLLKAGVNIYGLNTVRKHISKVKGGRLAEIAYPAKVISLILSDVVGDRLDVIASGPTSPDKTTYKDALIVLENYGLMGLTPKAVLEVLYR